METETNGDIAPIMPYYQCFGIVQAVQITGIEMYHENALLQYVQDGVRWIQVTHDWFNRYQPKTGDFYVRPPDANSMTVNPGSFEENFRELGQSGMGFEEAFEHLVGGKNIARQAWNGNQVGAPVFILRDRDERACGEILKHRSDGVLEATQIASDDLFARDWYIVA